MSYLEKILNLTSDPIIIQTLICSFVIFLLTFIIKCMINILHKTFQKHSIKNGFRTHHF